MCIYIVCLDIHREFVSIPVIYGASFSRENDASGAVLFSLFSKVGGANDLYPNEAESKAGIKDNNNINNTP